VERRFPSRHRISTPALAPVQGRTLVASNMRRIRSERKISQETLAELSGLNRGYLSSVENGRRNVSIDNICKIAAALAVSPRELLDPTS
jgi:transcriptional regulator with XRE-family HTH domain